MTETQSENELQTTFTSKSVSKCIWQRHHVNLKRTTNTTV